MATNASSDNRAHHQLLSLVENYAEERLNKERAIDELKKKRAELASEVESAFADLERMKQNRIAAHEEVRELHNELEAIKAAANLKQANLSTQQAEISKTSTVLKNLEDEGVCTRDSFISTMMEINIKVRKMTSAKHSTPPLQTEYQSPRCEPGILENSQPFCEPSVEKASTGIKDEGQSELLERIGSAEGMLIPLKENIECQQEQLREHKRKHSAYIGSIEQAVQELTSTRKYPPELTAISGE
ncbi:unnamed protein product [Calypogeia fissa]